MLGENHPVTMIWTQREDLLLQVANEALHLSYVVLRSCEEDRHSEGTAEAHAATADTMQPAVVKVKVCSVTDDAAASNLPVGKVASGGFTVGTDTATRPCRPQATPAEREETQPVAGLQAADATQPATLRTAGTTPPAENKVQVKTTIEASCASPHLPVGKLASGGHPATVETAPRLQTAPEVQDCYSYRTAGTTPPAAYQVSCGGLSAESWKLQVEAQAAADSVQPATDQVIVTSVEYNDAAANLPLSNVANGPQAGQAESGKLQIEDKAAPESGKKLQVEAQAAADSV